MKQKGNVHTPKEQSDMCASWHSLWRWPLQLRREGALGSVSRWAMSTDRHNSTRRWQETPRFERLGEPQGGNETVTWGLSDPTYPKSSQTDIWALWWAEALSGLPGEKIRMDGGDHCVTMLMHSVCGMCLRNAPMVNFILRIFCHDQKSREKASYTSF